MLSSADCELAASLISTMAEKGLTLACAESCTGGLLCAALTDQDGASKVFLGGAIVYAGRAKIDLLGVLPETIQMHGTVSRETAQEMADGARSKFHAGLAVSITGVAGDKPLIEAPLPKDSGLVYIGLADSNRTFCREHQFTGTRREIRSQALRQALIMIREYLV